MAKHTIDVPAWVRAKYPATLPEGWQSMTGPELAKVLPLGTVAAILDGRAQDARLAEERAKKHAVVLVQSALDLVRLKAEAEVMFQAAERQANGKKGAATRKAETDQLHAGIRKQAAEVRASSRRRLSEEEVAEKIGVTRKILRRAHGKST